MGALFRGGCELDRQRAWGRDGLLLKKRKTVHSIDVAYVIGATKAGRWNARTILYRIISFRRNWNFPAWRRQQHWAGDVYIGMCRARR
jgi:hypothetical protein